MNIEPIILHKKTEDLPEAGALMSVRERNTAQCGPPCVFNEPAGVRSLRSERGGRIYARRSERW
jgi:hypothetical protein